MFVFWLGTLGAKKATVQGPVTDSVHGGASPQPATGH